MTHFYRNKSFQEKKEKEKQELFEKTKKLIEELGPKVKPLLTQVKLPEKVIVTKPNSIFITTLDKNNQPVEEKETSVILDFQGNFKSTKSHGKGTYSYEFTENKAGIMKFKVLVNEIEINEDGYSITIIDQVIPLESSFVITEKQMIIIETKNREKKKIYIPETEVECILKNKKGGNTIKLKDNKDGSYVAQIEETFYTSGDNVFIVNVNKTKISEKTIKRSDKIQIKNCSVEGPGVSKELEFGKPVRFNVIIRNEEKEVVKIKSVNVVIADEKGKRIPHTVLTEGSSFEYTPISEGVKVMVQLGEDHIPGSPFILKVKKEEKRKVEYDPSEVQRNVEPKYVEPPTLENKSEVTKDGIKLTISSVDPGVSSISFIEFKKREKTLEEVKKKFEIVEKEMDDRSKPKNQKSQLTQLAYVYRGDIATILGQISNAKKVVEEKISRLKQLIEKAKSDREEIFFYVLNAISFKMCEMAKLQISRNHQSAFAYSTILYALTQAYPALLEVFLATINQLCPWTVPRIVHKKKGESENDYLKEQGYDFDPQTNQPISTRDYAERMSGMIILYASFIQQPSIRFDHPHGLEHGWNWVARLLNLPPNEFTFVFLMDFLQICGHSLKIRYSVQFKKIIEVIQNHYLKKFPEKTDFGSVKMRLTEFCSNFVNLKEPYGRFLEDVSGQKGE